ncbi:GDP-L-fucose synthase [bacterium AH-315-P15]|nr:GDP-L-fucose synthase [bacterium AH-315-P15]
MNGKRIWLAGHRGMVGAALIRLLQTRSCTLLTAPRESLDLRRQKDVEDWIAVHKPDAVIVASARVGGIHANDAYAAEFLYDNMMIEANIIESARRNAVGKLLFLGSSCIYPREAPQPLREDALLSGPLELTNQWYAVAKIAGIKLCQAYRKQYGCDFISAMPANLYGPGDNFHPENSHVLPALMARFHSAKCAGETTLTVWGTGRPRREFLHVDDCARALVFLLEHYSDAEHINVGTGRDLSILKFAELMAKVVGYTGAIEFDTSRPDGTPRKLLDVTRLTALGWSPEINLEAGVTATYNWFKDTLASDAGSLRGL